MQSCGVKEDGVLPCRTGPVPSGPGCCCRRRSGQTSEPHASSAEPVEDKLGITTVVVTGNSNKVLN